MRDPQPDRTLLGLPIGEFAFPGPLRDELVGLVLAGVKVATAGLLVEFEADGDAVPEAGDRAVVVDSGGQPVAIIETTDCRIVRVADVDDRFAIDEGEGFADRVDWRRVHERFWRGYLDDLRTRLGDPSFDITDDTLVVCERFRLVVRLDPASGSASPGDASRATA